MIRTIDVREISKNIKEMCIETGGAGRKITAWKTDIGTAAGKFKNCG